MLRSAAILVEEGKQEAQVLGQQVYEILPFKDLYSGAHSRAVLAAQDDAQRRMQEALVGALSSSKTAKCPRGLKQ